MFPDPRLRRLSFEYPGSAGAGPRHLPTCLLNGKVKVKVAYSCPTLCNPIEYTVHGILQARILEWVAISFSRGSSQPRDRTQVSCIVDRFFTSWATRKAQLFFFFWLTSLCRIGSRFIQLVRTDSNMFLFMTESRTRLKRLSSSSSNIPLSICTIASLSIQLLMDI